MGFQKTRSTSKLKIFRRMIIKVLSKFQFEQLMAKYYIDDDNVEEIKDTFFVSINDTKTSSYYKESWFKRDHDNVMVLYFDDVESEGETSPTNSGMCTPFSEDMAKSLVEFIIRNIESKKENCIIHCEAGISRSGAVGLFANYVTRSDHYTFMKNNPQVRENSRVSRMLRKIYRENNEY